MSEQERPEDCVAIGRGYDPKSEKCKDCALRLGSKFRRCYDVMRVREAARRYDLAHMIRRKGKT